MKNVRLFYGIILSLFIVIWACEEDDICLEGGTPRLHIQFKVLATDEPFDIDTLIVQRLNENNEFEFVLNAAKVDSVLLPMRLDVDQTKFVFAYQTVNPIFDTLTLNYNLKSVFISKACGFKENYENIQVENTENEIKRIDIEQNNITNEKNPHLSIFY